MLKNIIIILIVLSILLYFVADFLFNKATELYNKYHIKKVEHKNNDNIYFSMKFYDEPTTEWEYIENIYIDLISISLLFKKISPILLSISSIIYLLNKFQKQPTS